jgi:hypothetical protein
MATAGIFTLITNDGRQDRMLMASEILKTRLNAIESLRAANYGEDNKTPTLLDIEKTHILFTNAHFKPFAAVGYEYNKVTPSAGSTNLGSDVVFSIPQFGDFFHDMVLHISLQQPQMVLTGGPDASNQPLMRWCSFPGERVLEKVEFEVNGNPLDSYHEETANYHREFFVQPNKEVGWYRCVGQEEPEEGFVDQPNWVGSGLASSAISSRWEAKTFSGDQTPTGQKLQTVYKDLYIPLLFWCCRDIRLAVPSIAIPYGQRFIKMTLAPGDKLVNLYPRGTGTWENPNGSLNYNNMVRTINLYINNIFVNPEVHTIFIKRIGFSLIRVHRRQIISATKNSDEFLLQQLKWPIEFMFVGVKPADYNSSTPALRAEHLDKWHSFSQVDLVPRTTQGWVSGKSVLKSNPFALPAGAFNNGGLAADVLTYTVTAPNPDPVIASAVGDIVPGDVLQVTVAGVVYELTVRSVSELATQSSVITFNETVGSVVGAWGATPLTEGDVVVAVYSSSTSELSATVKQCTKTVDSLSISAHGISIYNDFASDFYNAYIPYHFGGSQIRVPRDCGAMMVNFSLYPGSYQPSGHINVSRAREFYLKYTSSVIESLGTVTIVVLASAINFLLISDGSAVLRYST